MKDKNKSFYAQYGDSGHIDNFIKNGRSDHVNRIINSNISLNNSHIDKFIDSKKIGDRIIASGIPNLTKEHIDKLVNDPHEDVREKIAKNKDLTKEHIYKLVNDPDIDVVREISRHPNLKDVGHLLNFSSHPDWAVRAGVGENPNTPEDILNNMSNNDPDDYVRRVSVNEIKKRKRNSTNS